MKQFIVALVLFATSNSSLAVGQDVEFYLPVVKTVEGWTVKVDPKLIDGEHAELGASALRALGNHLQRVAWIVPADKLIKLRKMKIWLEYDNPPLRNMQYHPNRAWLESHGHNPELVGHVHIGRARNLLDRNTWAKHPYCVLHELAHAYHDQVLGWDDEEILRTFRNARDKKIYDQVLDHRGRTVRHYGLNNHKEYFAESTEAYFGVNDFYPFVRAELREHDPQMFSLLKKIWGPVD